MFEKVTPEAVGISSQKVLGFIKTLDDCRLHSHGILMARGNQVFAECYYKPFDENTLHRMYSVSKSFVAIAVGMAVTEGILSLDDVIIHDFPEFINDNADEFHEECTVRDMLSMQSNIGSGVAWWGKFAGRVNAYYSLKTNKVPGTLYFYDSIGSFLLGCMIEKRTGKPFLEYLKETVLLEIGFSKESYVLREPGGFTVGDSGVLCTLRDLALFARFIMQQGQWNGKQYIDRAFMESAIMKQVSNDLDGSFDSYDTRGYGYLIWKTHPDGFSLVGMGDQLAICDMKRDLLFVIISDNQANKAARHIIYHEYYRHFLSEVQDRPLPDDPEAQKLLEDYLTSRELLSQYGSKTSAIASAVNGVRYITRENPLHISWFSLQADGQIGMLVFERFGKTLTLPFDLCHNKLTTFSFGERAVANYMGKTEPGEYTCAVSAAWIDQNTFSIQAHIIDTYLGCLNVHISFKDNRATLLMRRSGQYIFEDIDGFAIGTSAGEKPSAH